MPELQTNGPMDRAPLRKNEEGLSLSHQAYLLLRRAIVTHELAPGERVSESSLVGQFNLTKSAVRSAMTRLSSEQFIVASSPKIQTIAPLTMDEVRSVFQMRNLLEPNAARAAAGKIDRALLQRLDAVCEADYTFGDHDQEYAFLEANKNFHMAIAEAAGNQFQTGFVGRLHDAAMRILWVSLQIENRSSVWRHGHQDIVAALIEGDGNSAADLALKHLLGGQRLVYEVLASSRVFKDIPIQADERSPAFDGASAGLIKATVES